MEGQRDRGRKKEGEGVTEGEVEKKRDGVREKGGETWRK